MTAHFLFESLGYFLGGQCYWWSRRSRGDVLSGAQRMFVSGAALLGAAFGAKLLAMLENPWQASLEGKTIVGGLLGGLAAVELAKKHIGVTRSTGDLFALPLIVGTAIGRVGCYLSGLADGTATEGRTAAGGMGRSDARPPWLPRSLAAGK